MLVLERGIDEPTTIGDGIVVTVVEIRGDKVRLGFTAPAEVPIVRHNAKVREPKAGRLVPSAE